MGKGAYGIDIRAYFEEIRTEQVVINQLKNQIVACQNKALIKSMQYDRDRIIQSPEIDKLERVMSELADYQTELVCLLTKHSQHKKAALKLLNQYLPNPIQRAILKSYYLDSVNYRKSFADVAVEIALSERQVYRLVNDAFKFLLMQPRPLGRTQS